MIKRNYYKFYNHMRILSQTHSQPTRKLALVLLVLVLSSVSVFSLQPTAPIIASPNTQSSPSNLIFSFNLNNDLPTTSYLLIVFPFYSVTISPRSCTLLNQMITTAVTCQNLNTASSANPNPLTINATRVNALNPNVQTTLTIVVSFSHTLTASTSYSIQILLQNNLPAIGALSESFQMYVMSGTGVMIEQNWNMGQVYLQLRNNNMINLVSINSQIGNLPGTTVSTLLIAITIGVACPTPLSTFLFTISGNYQFTVSSLVSSIAVSGSPPQILSTTVVSPNIIRVIFNQQFVVGRQFRLSVSNIFNPLEISQGAVSLYSLPYNSITPLQISELTIPYQTVSYSPTLTLYTAEGVSVSAPMQFYMDTVQYITLTALLPRSFDPSFILQIKSDALYFQKGSVYCKTSTINSNSLVYTHPDSQTIQISGFSSTLPSGTLVTITFSAWIGTSPIFNIYVSIDKQAHITANAPIIYGTTSATVSAIPEPFISGFTGNSNEPNTLTAMQTTTSSISFSVTPLFQTFSGSFLRIFTSKNLVTGTGFSGSTSCLVNLVAQPCTLVTNTQFTLITIASSSSFNLYPMSTNTAVQINNLNFLFASSHSTYIYHFYFQLTVSLASGATVKKYLAVPAVIKERNILSNFNIYFSNNVYNSGSNFLNVIRLVSSDSTQWQNVIQVNQKRIISIFAYQGWTNLFSSLSSYSTYPCGSNLAATYTYIQGSNNQNLTNNFPLNWDRINIILPGTQSSSKFSIIIPTLYPSTSPYLFEIMVGFVDTNNGEITYLQAGSRPVSGSSTYLTPMNILVYAKPKQAAMQLNIAGLAGSYRSGVSFTVSPSNSYQGTTYSSGLIVVSSWQFYDSLTGLSSTSLASADPVFANVEQTPICLKISSSSYLTYIPFKTAGTYTTNFNIFFDNLKFPYSLDLPYYSATLIDSTGSIDGYNQFINQDQNIFYTGVLNDLTISCHDNSLGVSNTYCTIGFKTFQEIEIGSILVANLFGMFVSTDRCSMAYASTHVAVNVVSCTPNINLNVMTIVLGNTQRLPSLTSYEVLINGISIDASQRSNYVTFQVMDPTGSYAIEQKTVILLTSVTRSFPIEVSQVNFAINNPVVFSSLYINFTLPRALNADEAFALVLSKDFITLNNIPCKIRIRLLQANGVTAIPVTWVMKVINSQIIFENLQSILTAAPYSLEFYGIQTPSTVGSDMISLIYLRIYDNTYTSTNTPSSTASFPSLTWKVDSLITLQTYFNTEGLEHELLFTVVNQFAPITQNTVWYVNLPIYYPANVWNYDYLIHCTISGTPLTCGRSAYTPYQIVIKNSPLLIAVGPTSTYTISIYGIPCPRAAYTNGNTMFVTEAIFFAMAESSSSTSYSDYSSLYVSNTIVNPQTELGYGSLILRSITSSNMQVYQTTFLTITLTSSVAIPLGSWIFITFPSAFNNFNNIPVVVQTQYSASNYEVSTTSTVVNTRIGYNLASITIPANNEFQIMVTSLLTPKDPVTIDMNQIRIVVATSDRLSTIATSVESRNQLGSLTFLPNSLHLVVNNYNPIQITAGTYSNPVRINPSDNSTFLTNMLVTFSSNDLSFSANPTYLYLGNAFSTFIIGAGQNTIPKTYTFNLIKKQTSISAFYSTLSEYAVMITSIPITINFPASFTVPKGGCSMPVAVQLTNPPFSYITIYYEYDTTVAPPSDFWANQEISYKQMQFDINNTQRWVSFCTSSTISVTSFPITLNIGGDNAASFVFSTATTTITIDSSGTNTAPTFSISAANIQKTFATIQVTTNVLGYFYYELSISPLSVPLTLTDIHTYIKSNSPTLQSNTDYLTTRIYSVDRDRRVGYSNILIAGASFVNIEQLLPERQYTLCGYFENLYSLYAGMKCINFTMQAWGVISKAYVEFSSPILANQLNNVLCFFVKASDSEITQIVDLEGSSCSLYTSPQNYFYTYKGNTTTNQLSSTYIYHTSDRNLTSDASVTAFRALFDSNGISSTSLSLAQTQFSINFISRSYFVGTFQPMIAINAGLSSFQPSVSFVVGDYVKGTYSATVSNLKTSVPATIYFVLVSYKNITKNQIKSTTTISIRTLVTPSQDQIASCTDGAGVAAIQCHRVAMIEGSTYSFSFKNLVENSVYALHYAYANEYPERPIFWGQVKTQYIFTTVWQRWLQQSLVLISLLILLIL